MQEITLHYSGILNPVDGHKEYDSVTNSAITCLDSYMRANGLSCIHFLCLQYGLGYSLLDKECTKEEYSASAYIYQKRFQMVDVQWVDKRFLFFIFFLLPSLPQALQETWSIPTSYLIWTREQVILLNLYWPTAFTLISCSTYSLTHKIEVIFFSKASVEFQRTTLGYISHKIVLF